MSLRVRARKNVGIVASMITSTLLLLPPPLSFTVQLMVVGWHTMFTCVVCVDRNVFANAKNKSKSPCEPAWLDQRRLRQPPVTTGHPCRLVTRNSREVPVAVPCSRRHRPTSEILPSSINERPSAVNPTSVRHRRHPLTTLFSSCCQRACFE